METIIKTMMSNIELITQLIVAIAALITTGILLYKKIKKEIEEIKAVSDLKAEAVSLVATAAYAPEKLFNILTPQKQAGVGTLWKEDKNELNKLVTAAVVETQPTLVQKAGKYASNILQVSSIVQSAYNSVKPLIKLIKK